MGCFGFLITYLIDSSVLSGCCGLLIDCSAVVGISVVVGCLGEMIDCSV